MSPPWGYESFIPDAELLTSEVVTNAVVHAGGPVRVGVDDLADSIVVVVEDPQALAAAPRPALRKPGCRRSRRSTSQTAAASASARLGHPPMTSRPPFAIDPLGGGDDGAGAADEEVVGTDHRRGRALAGVAPTGGGAGWCALLAFALALVTRVLQLALVRGFHGHLWVDGLVESQHRQPSASPISYEADYEHQLASGTAMTLRIVAPARAPDLASAGPRLRDRRSTSRKAAVIRAPDLAVHLHRDLDGVLDEHAGSATGNGLPGQPLGRGRGAATALSAACGASGASIRTSGLHDLRRAAAVGERGGASGGR